MINEISEENQLDMIVNITSYSDKNKYFIYMNFHKMINNIKTLYGNMYIQKRKDDYNNLWRKFIVNVADGKSTMINCYKKIKCMPSDSYEGISNVFFTFYNDIICLHELFITRDYKKYQIYNFFKEILPIKIRAMINLPPSSIEEPKNKYDEIDYSIEILKDIFCSDDLKSIDYIVAAFKIISQIIFQNKYYNELCSLYSISTDISYDDLILLKDKLYTKEINIMELIDKAKMYKYSSISDTVMSTIPDTIPILCIPDISDFSIMSYTDLRIEIIKLSPDNLKRYIGDCELSYIINEKMTGYLKLVKGLNLTKVVLKHTDYYTITNIDDKYYLLFTIDTDPAIHAISFPAGVYGTRTIIKFPIPENIDYKLNI